MKNFYRLLFLMFSFLAFSQTTISGNVSYRNNGIKGINVTLKNTYDGATTDENGRFSFSTSKKGSHTLVFSDPKFLDVEKPIEINETPVEISVKLKEKVSEIDAVVITVGSIEASDKNRATALLSPIDIYTTAGADGQISTALNYLPGTQKVGESEGLFIRGGTGTEAKIFMDGNLVNNYFSNSVPGIAGRDRFNTSLFKGNVFSSGGYSALYGQALSGVLLLESVDLPEQTSYDFGVSPLFLSANYQKLNVNKKSSYGISASYSNLDLMQKIFDFNTDFSTAPNGFNTDANFRVKTKKGGFIKYYGSFDQNKLAVKSKSLEPEYDYNEVGLNAKNTFHNISYRQKIGAYLLKTGASFSYNNAQLDFSTLDEEIKTSTNSINSTGNYLNFKSVVERKIGKISAVRGGLEFNNTNEKTSLENFDTQYKDLISSLFAEADLGFSNYLSAKIGLRTENSSFLEKTNFAPRLALAYRLSKKWTSSFAYGLFYQNPESRYLYEGAPAKFQKAEHYIFQLQRSSQNRSLRLEAFYKNYDYLTKTKGTFNNSTQQSLTFDNNNGNGFAKGIELFWRDKETIKNIDYWVSYSYLDSKRNFLNYPISLTPSFASEHTLSVVAKKFVPKWKTGFNASFTYAKGRPYYDIVTENGDNIIRNQGGLKDYNALNLSINYLPSLGKKDAKSFTVLVLSVSNVLGNKNIYGYNFSADGARSSAIVPPINTFVFLGAFFSFGIDKTQDAINNNL